MPVRVLIVENDADLGELLQTTLLSLGYEVLGIATDAREAIEIGSRELPDVTLVDPSSPGWLEAGDGIERALRAPRISLAPGIDSLVPDGSEESGYFGYVTKPFDGPKLRAAIEVTLFRHRLEAILRESEGSFRTILEAATDAVVVTDPRGMITFVNPAAEQLVGIGADGLMGHQAASVVELVGADLEPVSDLVLEALEGRETRTLPRGCSVRNARRGLIPVHGNVSVISARGSGVLGTVTVLHDVTAQRAEEQRLREQEKRYWKLYAGDVWANFVLGEGGRILECSTPFAELLGVGSREGMQGRSIREFLPVPLEYDYVSAVLRERGRILPHERTLRRIDGVTLHVVMSMEALSDEPGTALARMVDVSERRRLQGQNEEIRRMDAVGRLASGSAHTLSNVLQVVLGSAGLLAQEPLPKPLMEDVGRIIEAAERGSATVRDLLAVGQRRMMQDRAVEASELVRQMLPMISERAGPRMLTLLQLPADPLWARADPTFVSQALGALVDNAREAMPGGGSVSVEIVPVTVRPEEADWAGGLQSGEYVGISVKDSGPGMEESTRAQALEPFFTTKAEHDGLGLAVASGLTRQQGGWLSLESDLEEGTRVTIHLPRVSEPPRAQPTS